MTADLYFEKPTFEVQPLRAVAVRLKRDQVTVCLITGIRNIAADVYEKSRIAMQFRPDSRVSRPEGNLTEQLQIGVEHILFAALRLGGRAAREFRIAFRASCRGVSG